MADRVEELGKAGLPQDFLAQLESSWQDPGTADAVLGLLRAGKVLPHVHTLFMNA